MHQNTGHCWGSLAGLGTVVEPGVWPQHSSLIFGYKFSWNNALQDACRMHVGCTPRATTKTNFGLSTDRLAGRKHAEKTLTFQQVS